MKYVFSCILLVNSLAFYQGAIAQGKQVHTSKEPAWVALSTVNYNNQKLESQAEDGYLDLDYEQQVSMAQKSSYFKRSMKIVTESGVQNNSEVSVNFDPAYEQLTFHTLRIVRNEKVIDKLNVGNFIIIQQEKDLGRHMYDGSLTALLLLDDVRKGDVVEYSYTLKGANPIFKGVFSDVFACMYSVPIGTLEYRLLVPDGRTVTIKNSQTTVSPVNSHVENQTIYDWKLTDVAAMHTEEKTPDWYDPYPRVEISEYKNWQAVSQWASALFPKNAKLSAALMARIQEIKAANATDESRILAALRLVQDDIRYMGIEMGVNSHKPTEPNKIFAQRFGDCKDKSYLLVTILNSMGIEADPVLINTDAKKSLLDWLPTATAFDHTTVRAKLDGKYYWFDPTISFQRGVLKDISYPDYQVGLVVNEQANALTTIPAHEPGVCDTKEFFTIPDMTGLAYLKVVTVNTGLYADDTRDYFNNNSLYEMKTKYKKFYTAYFDKITSDSLTYTDDEKTGAFTTTEYYTIKELWKTEDGNKKAPFYAYLINDIMTKPADKNRTMPFRQRFPIHYKEALDIQLPEVWSLESFDQQVTSAAFTLRAVGWAKDNKIMLSYDYETLKDHVTPEEAKSFFAKFDEANSVLAYTLTYKSNDVATNRYISKTTTSTSIFPKLYTLLGICIVVTFLVRRQQQKEY